MIHRATASPWEVAVPLAPFCSDLQGGIAMAAFSARTPWGKADHVENLGRGVMSVSTPSHGGLFVPESMVGNVSDIGRNYAQRWGGSDQWYEEDCAWAYVAEAFPDLFTPEALESARVTREWLHRNRTAPATV